MAEQKAEVPIFLQMALTTMESSITTKHIVPTDSFGLKLCIIAVDFPTMFSKVKELSKPEVTPLRGISIMVQGPKVC